MPAFIHSFIHYLFHRKNQQRTMQTLTNKQYKAQATIKAANHLAQSWKPEQMVSKIAHEIGVSGLKPEDPRLTVLLKDIEQYRNGSSKEKSASIIKLLQALNKPEIWQMFKHFKSHEVDFDVEKTDTPQQMRQKVCEYYGIADQVKNVLGSSHAAVGRKAVAKRLAGGGGNKPASGFVLLFRQQARTVGGKSAAVVAAAAAASYVDDDDNDDRSSYLNPRIRI
jgi:hypothetical protein